MITAEAVALGAVGPEWDSVFAAGPGLQSRRAWFAASAEAAMPAGAEARVLLVREDGAPAGLVPLQTGPGGRLGSLTTPYTCLYQPLAAPGTDLRRIGAALGRYCRSRPVTILEAIDAGWAGLPPFVQGLRDSGLAVRRFGHFGNWHLPVPGWTWDRYLASRPGRLRETMRRKSASLGRTPDARLEIWDGRTPLGPALDAYEQVYRRSWKVPEPYQRFNAALLGRLGPGGLARIGLLWVGSQPVAAQYWTVADGTATVMKLAHDEAFKPLSPGTVLTAHMIRSLLEQDAVRELDFGRGDDDYKGDWVDLRRARIGLMIAAPWRPAGMWALARHAAGAALRRSRGDTDGLGGIR